MKPLYNSYVKEMYMLMQVGVNKFGTMPQHARKRAASPPSVSESWRRFGSKKIKLSDDSTASHDNRTSSLLGADPAAQEERLDGHRNQRTRKSQASSPEMWESWLRSGKMKKTLSNDTNTSHNNRTPSLSAADPAVEEHSSDGQWSPANKRSCSSASGWNESLRQNVNLELTADTSQVDDESFHKQKIIDDLRDMGVRLFEKREVNLMTDTLCEFLGEGLYGTCVKTMDPNTQHQLVIKGFIDDDLDILVAETMNLCQLQMEGVQRLVGVCVDTCEMISHFAGITAETYFENLISLDDAATIFLQVTQTLQCISERGFAHNDLHPGNICVSNGGSGPVATIIDFGLAAPSDSEDDGFHSLVSMIKVLLWSVELGSKHPLIAAVISMMEAAYSSDPEAERPTLSTLEEVLEEILDELLPSSTLVIGEEPLLERYESSETDESSE